MFPSLSVDMSNHILPETASDRAEFRHDPSPPPVCVYSDDVVYDYVDRVHVDAFWSGVDAVGFIRLADSPVLVHRKSALVFRIDGGIDKYVVNGVILRITDSTTLYVNRFIAAACSYASRFCDENEGSKMCYDHVLTAEGRRVYFTPDEAIYLVPRSTAVLDGTTFQQHPTVFAIGLFLCDTFSGAFTIYAPGSSKGTPPTSVFPVYDGATQAWRLDTSSCVSPPSVRIGMVINSMIGLARERLGSYANFFKLDPDAKAGKGCFQFCAQPNFYVEVCLINGITLVDDRRQPAGGLAEDPDFEDVPLLIDGLFLDYFDASGPPLTSEEVFFLIGVVLRDECIPYTTIALKDSPEIVESASWPVGYRFAMARITGRDQYDLSTPLGTVMCEDDGVVIVSEGRHRITLSDRSSKQEILSALHAESVGSGQGGDKSTQKRISHSRLH